MENILQAQPSYPQKRNQWLEVLCGNDRHSIINQLQHMIWSAAVFNIVNIARGIAPKDNRGRVKLNGMLHQLIDRGFSDCQLASIRRLVDDTYKIKGKRGVYSLIGLLDDMNKHKHLITRQAMFKAEELVYDYEKQLRESEQAVIDNITQDSGVVEGVDFSLYYAKPRHEIIDSLTGIAPNKRQPGDAITSEVFENLRNKINNACDKIERYATKHIAHASAPESRIEIKPVTFEHLSIAYRHLCQVVGFVSVNILGGPNLDFLAVPQFDQFEYIDLPLVDNENVKTLQSSWHEFSEECDQWGNWSINDYRNEFNSDEA